MCAGEFLQSVAFLFHSIYLQLKNFPAYNTLSALVSIAMNSINNSITYAIDYYTIFILSLIKLDFDYVTIYSDSLKYLVSL